MSKLAQLWTPAGPALADAMDVQVFLTAGTWLNPAPNKRRLGVFRLIGGGGGGGSGRRGAPGTVRCGGGGGGGGCVFETYFWTHQVGPEATVEPGAGGLPGAAPQTDNTNGATGTAGGNSKVMISLDHPVVLTARGGNPGAGGTTSSGAGGAIISNGCLIGVSVTSSLIGGAASVTGGVGGAPANSNLILPSGGGAGGGITSQDVFSLPGRGGAIAAAHAAAAGLASNYWSAAPYSAGNYAVLPGQNETPPHPEFRNPWGVGLGGGGGNDDYGRSQRGGFPGGGGGGLDARVNGQSVVENLGYGGDGVITIIVF